MIANIEKSMEVQKMNLIHENEIIRFAVQDNRSQINLNGSSLKLKDSSDHQDFVILPENSRQEHADHDYSWKQSICSKIKNNIGKNINTSIHKKFSILAKINPKLSNHMKLITQQIKHQLLKTKEFIENSSKNQIETQTIEKNEHIQENKQVFREEILPDKVIVKESCYRGLLKPTQIDNDVPSEDEDLNMGIRYMYGELLYSVGSQMVNQRENQKQQKTKQIAKKEKKRNHNKQNFNTNLPQEASKNQKNLIKIQKTRQPERNLNKQTLTIRN